MALADLSYYAFGDDPAAMRAARFLREHGPRLVSALSGVDTDALRTLHNAARAKANARRYGTTAQRVAANVSFNRAASANTARVAATRKEESQTPGILGEIERGLKKAGIVAALGIAAYIVATRKSGGSRSW